MKYLRLISGLLIIGFSVTAQAGKVFELRTYTTHEGKLPQLLSRFENHTLKLFEKHNMTNIGYWTPTKEKNTLIYIISHESQAAAKKNWKSFIADPVWTEAYEASRVNGPIVTKLTSNYLTSTNFSPLQ